MKEMIWKKLDEYRAKGKFSRKTNSDTVMSLLIAVLRELGSINS